MGGAASKSATRKLPTSVPSTTKHAAPTWANRPPPPDPSSSYQQQQAPPPHSSPQSSAEPSGTRGTRGHMQRGQGVRSDEPRGQPIGKSPSDFSGEKDDVVRRDALDPHFAANLSMLGQVPINAANQFIPTLASAQRTLISRRDELSDASAVPPAGHLSSGMLVALLDDLKSLPKDADTSKLVRSYGMTKEQVRNLTRWVNSPSVGEEENVVIVHGEEIRELKAVWIDSTSA